MNGKRHAHAVKWGMAWLGALLIGGCATRQGPQQTQQTIPAPAWSLAPLSPPVGLQLGDAGGGPNGGSNGGPNIYIDIRGVLLDAPPGTRLKNGSLRLAGAREGGFFSSSPAWIALADVAGWSGKNGNDISELKLKNGASFKLQGLTLQWCPPGGYGRGCLPVERLYGAQTELGSQQALAAQSAEMPVYGIQAGTGIVSKTFNAKEAAARRDTLAAAQAQQKTATTARAVAQMRETERKTKLLKQAKPGATLHCVSKVLLGKNEAVEDYLGLHCAPLGDIMLYALTEAGWQVQVTARLATENGSGAGDAVQILATKKD